jgi:hypothetical protein
MSEDEETFVGKKRAKRRTVCRVEEIFHLVL